MDDPSVVPLVDQRVWWKRWGVVPNGITILRILGCFVPAAMIIGPRVYTWPIMMPWWIASIIVFAIIAFTDRLDGMAARRLDSITPLGEKLDPVADKLLVIPTFVAVCWMGLILAPWGWIIFGLTTLPELMLVLMNLYLSLRGVKVRIPSILPGKIKMWVQCVGLMLALIPITDLAWQGLVISCFSIGLYCSYVAAYAYFRTGWSYLKTAQ